MKPRKFFGASSRDVLKQVREALGPDALIVSNAKVATGIEVIALPGGAINDIVGAAPANTLPEPKKAADAGSFPVRREPPAASTHDIASAAAKNRRTPMTCSTAGT